MFPFAIGKEKRMKIPQHVAIILDGNGRWAKSKGMPRNYGHTMGAKNVEKICDIAGHMGIKYLTVYAFSTENWTRPDSEVQELMRLLGNYMKTCLKTAKKHNMRVTYAWLQSCRSRYVNSSRFRASMTGFIFRLH